MFKNSEINLNNAVSDAKSEEKKINLDTIQFEGTFYNHGDSEKPCQAPAPAPAATVNRVLGSEIENKLSEWIRVQAQAMRQQQEINREKLEVNRENVEAIKQQTEIFRRQNVLKEQEVWTKGAETKLKDMPVFDGSEGFALVKFFQEFERCRSV